MTPLSHNPNATPDTTWLPRTTLRPARLRRAEQRPTEHRPTEQRPRQRPTDLRPTPLSTVLRLAADPARWRPHLDFDPDRRYYRRLLADQHSEAWLLTWLPGQGTEWHDHGGSRGAIVVVQGTLIERVAAQGVVRGSPQTYGRQTSRSFGPDHVHQLTNEGPDPAVSLHVYSPRLQLQNDYLNDEGILLHIATRRAGRDW